ncbi:O-antigen ligase family protein [Sphingomonas canadensis]|uniref:O-antigen ligase family protein n=1 Tax=Sphingomonas canadensis TaxID=1219257 RepID=A0ABW3H8W6_9SPHN|nr:O-antigen ligase family protein [Sphingomonas canadensis]MCW3837108.1 O-antigen ligase family protein [Sphingomonas canadensis]
MAPWLRNPGALAGGLLLLLAALLGGTSGEVPGRVMVLELLAIVTLILNFLFWRGPHVPRHVKIAVGVLLAVPLLQLVPLPFDIWSQLPGREQAAAQSAFIGELGWRPLTLDPGATIKTWLSLLLPVAMFWATLGASEAQRKLFAWILIGVAIFSVALGIAQVAIGSPWLVPFPTSHLTRFIGLFANRNHQASLLYISVALAIGLLAARSNVSPVRLMLLGAIIVLTAGLAATQSRAGMTLLVMIMALSALMFLPILGKRVAVTGAVVGLLGVVLLVSGSGVVRSGISRFAEAASDGRFGFWPDVFYASLAYFPAGSGLGTFVLSYQSMESLQMVGDHFINHAHNDYLELLLEGGVVALLCLAGFLALLGARAIATLRRRPVEYGDTAARAALVALMALLLHSFVDYPIRTYALLTVFGMLCGLLYRPGDERGAAAGRAPQGDGGQPAGIVKLRPRDRG